MERRLMEEEPPPPPPNPNTGLTSEHLLTLSTARGFHPAETFKSSNESESESVTRETN